MIFSPFNALTLLDGRQDGYPACKKLNKCCCCHVFLWAMVYITMFQSVSAQSMSITSASQTRTCEGSTTLDGGGSDSCSSGSRRRIRQTAMLSSSMAVTRSRNAIQAGRKHYTARTQEYTARSHDTRSAIQAGRKHYTARTHSTQPDHTTQTLHQHPAYTHIYHC